MFPRSIEHKIGLSTTSSTTSRFGVFDDLASVGTSTTQTVGRSSTASAQALSQADVERAVIAHIRAMKALGHDTINTIQISRALSLPRSLVESVIVGLRGRGVKVISR